MTWQARLIMFLMRVDKFFNPPTTKLDVGKDRSDTEKYARIFKPLDRVDVGHVNAGGVPAAWIVPSGLETEHVILYAHGGSYTSGSITSHIPLTGNIAIVARSRVLAIDYRLAPEHPFPAAVDDALSAYRWLVTQNISPRQIVVAGDSAGGGLVMSLIIAAREAGLPLPSAAIGLSPWLDLTCSGESWSKNENADFMLKLLPTLKAAEVYIRDADPRNPLVSPLFADLTGFPPILLQVGSDETILSDATRFAEKARSAGVDITLEIWKNMQHEWQYAARWLPEGRQALEKVGEFISKHCK